MGWDDDSTCNKDQSHIGHSIRKAILGITILRIGKTKGRAQIGVIITIHFIGEKNKKSQESTGIQAMHFWVKKSPFLQPRCLRKGLFCPETHGRLQKGSIFPRKMPVFILILFVAVFVHMQNTSAVLLLCLCSGQRFVLIALPDACHFPGPSWVYIIELCVYLGSPLHLHLPTLEFL